MQSQEFQQDTEKLGYIELKESVIDPVLKDFAGIPLPIYLSDLLDGIQSADFTDGVDLKHILDGIIINLAIDPDFRYASEYRHLLMKSVPDIEKYVLSEAVDKMRRDDERAIYYFLFLERVELDTPFSRTNYASLLYRRGQSRANDSICLEAIAILEQVISSDEDFPLSYFILGEINRERENYLKAYGFYQRALDLAEDETVREEIRTKLSEIEANAELERGISAIHRSDFDRALTHLNASKRRADSAVVNYYLGVVLSGLGKEKEALGYYQTALEKGGSFRELYLDASVSCYMLGDPNGALAIIQSGLELYHEDSELLFNRLAIYLQAGELNKAKEDIETILQYGDNPEHVLQKIIEIKRSYGI